MRLPQERNQGLCIAHSSPSYLSSRILSTQVFMFTPWRMAEGPSAAKISWLLAENV